MSLEPFNYLPDWNYHIDKKAVEVDVILMERGVVLGPKDT